VARLPDLLRDLERASATVADGGLRIHPDSIRELVERRDRHLDRQLRPVWTVLVLLAAALAVVAAAG